MKLQEYLDQIKEADAAAVEAARAHWDRIAKPLNSLGLLEEAVAKVAGITGSPDVCLDRKCVVPFCADNGVIAEGVAQSDNSVTAIVTENFAKGIATVNAMSRVAGADVCPVDIGVARDLSVPGLAVRKVAYGTKNFAKEPAMTRDQAQQAIITGIEMAGELKAKGYQLLAGGEMGIGNTTTSSAVISVLLDKPAAEVTGRGAGLSNDGLEKKISVISKGIALHKPDPSDPVDVLSKVGGFDLAGLAGLFLGGGVYKIPVVIDGLIAEAAALLAVRLCPKVAGYLLPSHLSREPAARMVMDALGLTPLLYANLSLGEGTGAVTLFPLLDMALAVYRQNSTFEKVSIPQYQRFEEKKG